MAKRKGFNKRWKLGELLDKSFFLGYRIDDLNSPTDFAVVLLIYPEEKQVVKIDISKRERINIHKYWRKKEKYIKEELYWTGSNLELFGRAITDIINNWERYARYYLEK